MSADGHPAGEMLASLAQQAKQEGHNDLADALNALGESERSGRNLKDPDGVIKALTMHAQTLTQKGRAADALPLVERALKLSVISGSHNPPRAFVHAIYEEARKRVAAYEDELAAWQRLPLWKRLRTKQPVPPRN